MKKFSLKSTRLSMLFSPKEAESKGRLLIVTHNCLDATIGTLINGVFYTGFLMIYGIDLVNIGIITFVPYIASCFNIFSPSILERFKKRKWIMAFFRGGYFLLNILGLTVMPALVQDASARIVCFVGIVLAANILNALGGSGYSVWHLHYLPERVRADYFAINHTIMSTVSLTAGLLSSLAADALAGSPYEDTVIILLRYAAFALAMVDMFILCSIKEPTYARSDAKPRLLDVFVKPVRNKKYLLTILLPFGCSFFANIPAAQLNYHLLNNIGVSYTMISVINIFFPLFLFVLRPLWKTILNRLGWFKTYALVKLTLLPTTLMYAFVSPANYLWLFPLLRFMQHFSGVGSAPTESNLPFINLPREDQTNYISFYTILLNIAPFLGMMTGTWFVSVYGSTTFSILGCTFTAVPVLLLMQSFGELLMPIIIVALSRYLTPENETV